MAYNPDMHHRRSIRLKGYDYSQAGFYFITICTQNREHLFGDIRRGEPTCSPDTCSCTCSPDTCSPDTFSPDTFSPDTFSPEMILNDAGMMIEKWYYELENKFHDIRCHEMIIMPNHFHCIIENVGVPLHEHEYEHVHVSGEHVHEHVSGEHVHEHVSGEHDVNGEYISGEHVSGKHDVNGEYISGVHVGSPLHRVVQWLKTMTTNEYIRGVKTLGWQPFDGKLWQRNYWEHIIRNEQEYQRISEYIINNPRQWDNDNLKSE